MLFVEENRLSWVLYFKYLRSHSVIFIRKALLFVLADSNTRNTDPKMSHFDTSSSGIGSIYVQTRTP